MASKELRVEEAAEINPPVSVARPETLSDPRVPIEVSEESVVTEELM